MDSDSSFLKSWSDELKSEIWAMTQRNVTKWCDIIIKTGIDDNAREDWTATFKDQVETLYKDMIDDALEQQKMIFSKIEGLLKRSEQLCKELQIKMPDFGEEQLSLSQEYLALAKRVQEYEQQVIARKEEVAVLQKQQERLCKLLGKETKIIPESPLPNTECLNEIRSYIDDLETEKFSKTERFLETKAGILKISEELGYNPNLNFEKIVLSNDDMIFIMSDDNMNELDQFHERLQDLQRLTTENIAELSDRIKSLWDILNEDVKVCAEFLQQHNGKTLATVEVLTQEVKRLDQIKRANIEKFVKSLRQELERLWELCQYTPGQRNEFEYFNTDLYTEDLLTLHDLEIQRLKRYHADNNELFTLLEKRHEMWTKLNLLENRVNAPDRFKNRGGQLLKEEKDRNTISKAIPHIESRLMELANQYEQAMNKPFTSWGNTVHAIIKLDYQNREEEKLLKLSARKRDKTITPGKSTLTLSHATSNQNLLTVSGKTQLKRKLIPTPEVGTKKPKLLTEAHHNVPKTAPPKLLLNGHTIKDKSRLSQEGYKIKKKYRRLSHRKSGQKKSHENESATSNEYDTFEKEIANKENCRSTLFGEACNSSMQDVIPLPLTPVRPKTPSFRTPRTGTKQRTPLTASKFSAAPSLKKLHF